MGRRVFPGRRVPAASTICLVAVLSTHSSAHAADDDPDVFVRGGRTFTGSRDPSLAASVVTERRLEAPGLRASEVLRMQPGVQVSESGGAGALATAAIRGATSAQTPVYLGGIRINDDAAGTADLSLVPLWMIRRIEIYRGGVPNQADRDGIGGAIFFDPKRPRELRPTIGALIGSFGSRAGWAYAGVGDSRSSAAAGVRHELATNDYPYRNDRGARLVAVDESTSRRTNAAVETTDVWVHGVTRLGARGELSFLANAVARTHGVPGLAVLPTRRAAATEKRELAAVSSVVPLGDTTITSTTTMVSGATTTTDPLEELGLGTERVEMVSRRVDQSISIHASIVRRLAVTTSVRGAYERLDISSQRGAEMQLRRFTATGGALLQVAISDRLTLRGSAQMASNTTRQGPKGRDELSPGLRTGAEYRAGPVQILVNVVRSLRVPSLGESYGVSATVRGNPELLPESAIGGEMGVRMGIRGIRGQIYGFGRRTDDLVSYSRTTSGYIAPYNVGSALVAGIELDVSASLGRRVSVECAGTLLDARDISAARLTVNSTLPFRSRAVVVPQLAFSLPELAALRALSEARILYVYQSSRFADAAGLVVIPEQGSLDIELNTEFAGGRVRARARVANLLDQPRFDLVGFPLPGRAAYSALEFQW